jgi:hypothetical protein
VNCDFDSRSKTFTCQHILGGSTVAAVTEVHKAAPGAPTQPPDSSGTRDVIQKIFKGEGEFVAGKKQKQRINLYFVYDARNRLQEITDLFVPTSEKLVRVSVVLIGKDPETHEDRTDAALPSFNTMKWDDNKKTLDGSQTATASGSSVQMFLTLDCTNFKLNDPNYNFQCIYTSTLAPGDVKLNLHAN